MLGEYFPSELLCPVTYNWVLLDESIKNLINQDKDSARLCDLNVIDDMDYQDIDLDKYVVEKTRISINGKVLGLSNINQNYFDYFKEMFKYLGRNIGKKLMSSFVFGQSRTD